MGEISTVCQLCRVDDGVELILVDVSEKVRRELV